MKTIRAVVAALAIVGLSGPALALDFTMDFDGIPPAFPDGSGDDPTFGSAVLGYYNDDPVFDRAGKQAWGVTFSPGALAIGSAESGGEGNFPAAESGCCAVGSVRESSFSFELGPGLFLSKLSFFYDDDGDGSKPGLQFFSNGISVYSLTLGECSGGGFCGWREIVVPEDAILGKLITRVEFSSEPNKAVFDAMSVSTVPETSTYALALFGLALISAAAKRRKR